nr:restriction endonuclease [uncultured Campylobacter sp.]
MTYEDFKNSLNDRIFGDDLNYEILETVLKNPQRYIGLFRVTNAKTKLIQNLTQSCEIKFGDFLEEILTKYIEEMKYKNLNKNIGKDEEGNTLSADQVFEKDDKIYLIEQKVRDDHDSTKKRGQYANLIKKIRCLKAKFPNKKICASMWFSDDSLKKNKNYYLEEISHNTDNDVKISLFYGNEIFKILFNREDVWNELINHLKQNKAERSNEILSIPDFDTSDEISKALHKLNEKCPKLIKKLISNQSDFVEIRKELFPTGKNLKGL